MAEDPLGNIPRLQGNDGVAVDLALIPVGEVLGHEGQGCSLGGGRIAEPSRGDNDREESIPLPRATDDQRQFDVPDHRGLFHVPRQPHNGVCCRLVVEGRTKLFFGTPRIQILEIVPGRNAQVALSRDEQSGFVDSRSSVAQERASAGISHSCHLTSIAPPLSRAVEHLASSMRVAAGTTTTNSQAVVWPTGNPKSPGRPETGTLSSTRAAAG